MVDANGFEPIRNRNRARQLVSFRGMNLGDGRWPTDFDAVIDWDDRAWLVYEVKHGDAPMPPGQKKALTRFVNDIESSLKPAIAMVVEHHVDDPSVDIELSECNVRSVYYDGVWKPPKKPTTAGELTVDFISHIERKGA